MSSLSFDEFQPKRVVPVKNINEFTRTTERVVPVATTTQDLKDYPRTWAYSSLAEKWLAHAEKAKPPADLDNPWNTNYKDQRKVNNPNVAVTWTPADGQVISKDLYGATDELAGGKTRLQNSAAARNPIVRLYGNIPRVLVDNEKNDNNQKNAAGRPTEYFSFAANMAKEDEMALEFYNGVEKQYRKIGFHNQVTPLVKQFLDPANVAFIHMSIERGLTDNLHASFDGTGNSKKDMMGVRIDSYDALEIDLVQAAMDNQSMAYSEPILEQLNKAFIDRTVSKMAPSIRQQERNRRWFLEDNRTHDAPYAQPTRTQKGEVTLDTSSRALKDPVNRFRDQYMQATGLGQHK